MNWSQQGHLQPLLMFSYTSINLIGVHWSHWIATTWWLDCCDMCLISFSWDSVIYYTLTSVRAQLSQLGFWSVVNLSVDCGLHSVKLDSLIQFEWPPWEFELLFHSCLQHDHVLYYSFFVWIYRATTHFVAQLHHFHVLLLLIFYETVLESLDYYGRLTIFPNSLIFPVMRLLQEEDYETHPT